MAPQRAGWDGRYRVVDVAREHLHYAGDDYESCHLTDLSMGGAGLRLVDSTVEVGDRIELDLPLGASQRASIRVRGDIRHLATDDGSARAGLEFVDVGDLERALLLRLLRDLREAELQPA